MTIGDFLEWIAGGLFITAAYLAGGDASALAVGGVFAFYEAQVFAGSTFTLRKRSKSK